MNALSRVQSVRQSLVEYLNSECAKITRHSGSAEDAINLIKHLKNVLKIMLLMQVIAQDEAIRIGGSELIQASQSGILITLQNVSSGRFGLNHEWDLQETDEVILKKYWRAQATAVGAKLVKEYKTTNDAILKHNILDILVAGVDAGKLTGALTPSERKQLSLYVNQSRQELSGG